MTHVPYKSHNFKYYCYHMRRIWAKALIACVQEGRDWYKI